MTNLTEKWKKGELPYAEYYIKLAGGEYTNDVWDVGGWQSFNKKGDVVVEVLAPVPSYEKWIMTKNLSERAHLEMYKARGEKVRLEKENAQLKELLKRIGKELNDCPTCVEGSWKAELVDKIDQVLGE